MRKLRDYDSELNALSDKARTLKERRVRQLGELVIACGADVLPPEQLAGALLAAVDADTTDKEGWRKRGATFFRRSARATAKRTDPIASSASSDHGGAAST